MAKPKTDTWDSSDYLRRKAERQKQIPPQWKTNPETGERFYVRTLGHRTVYVAGNMATMLKEESLTSWEDKGVEIPSPEGSKSDNEEQDLNDLLSAGRRNALLMGKTVMEACVIPKIVLGPPKAKGEIDLADLQDSDLAFIYRCALGTDGTDSVELQGGESMPLQELKSVSRRPRKGSRTIARG